MKLEKFYRDDPESLTLVVNKFLLGFKGEVLSVNFIHNEKMIGNSYQAFLLVKPKEEEEKNNES